MALRRPSPSRDKWNLKPLNKIDFIHHQIRVINQQATDKAFLKIYWSYFHLRFYGGVVVSPPGMPVDAISAALVSTVTIEAIQV